MKAYIDYIVPQNKTNKKTYQKPGREAERGGWVPEFKPAKTT